MQEFINRCEAVHEEQITAICDNIVQRRPRMVLIAGPSSSGKTTLSHRLSDKLRQYGVMPSPISLDDYYLPVSECPVDEDGKPDFETVHSLNIPLFRQTLANLAEGKEVELPCFDFDTDGPVRHSGRWLKMTADTILVIEGLHALNPLLTPDVSPSDVFRIHIAPDDAEINGRQVRGADRRLLRRIIRDIKHRNAPAEMTLRMWPSVCKGEKQWIDPFVPTADVHFDSGLPYEFSLVATQAIPALQAVPSESPYYSTAQTLLTAIMPLQLSSQEISSLHIPADSLLCEFLG